jgi:hypothetical protein
VKEASFSIFQQSILLFLVFNNGNYRLPGWFSGIALDYGLDDWGFESRQGPGIFLFTTASRTALGPTQPPIQWVPAVLSLRVKRPEHEADHSPPSSADVKNTWGSVKAQGQLYVYLF